MIRYFTKLYEKLFKKDLHSKKKKESYCKKPVNVSYSEMKIESRKPKIPYEEPNIPHFETRIETKPLRFIRAKVLTDRVESQEQIADGEGTYDIMTLDSQLISSIYESVCYKVKKEPEKIEQQEIAKSKMYFLQKVYETHKEVYDPRKYFKEAEKKKQKKLIQDY